MTDPTAHTWAGVAGVLLDADDTVYDTRSAMHHAGAQAAATLWPDADLARVERRRPPLARRPGGPPCATSTTPSACSPNSSAAYTAAKVRASGLDGLLDVVCSTDTLGFGRPDPLAFHEACRRLGTEPAHTAYVGDELRTYPLGARGRGMPAAWLVRDGAPDTVGVNLVASRGAPVVTDLREVLVLVGRDLGAGGRTGSILPRFA